MRKFALLPVIALALVGCKEDTSSATRETRQTMVMSEQASVTIGMPAIKNFTEKRQLKTIYELRDTANLVTYTYIFDMHGKRHKVCPTTSVGFGIPYSTQYTAPKALRAQRPLYGDGTQYVENRVFEADQPEPNGLFMPASADGTWVLCLHPDGKSIAPTYVEPRVIVYLFEMSAVD